MKKNLNKYLIDDLLTVDEGVIEKKIMQKGFDFIERRTAWQGMISDTFAEIEQKEVQKTSNRRLWQYAAATGLALIVALGIWAINAQFNKKSAPKPPIQQGNGGDKSVLVADVSVEELLSKSVDDFQATITRKGSDDVDNWQADFQAGNYTTVIKALESIGKDRTVEQTYFLAMAYLKIDPKNTLKAQPLFKLVSVANSDKARGALWSYALICVLHKQNEAAKTALDEVIEKSNAHKEEARKLRLTLN
jgi:hypothetical protein